MAQNRDSALFLISLLLFVASKPLAHAQSPITLNVIGQICCTSTGNCPGQGIPRAVVSLNCTNFLNSTITLGRNTTNANGTFSISVRAVVGRVGSLPILPCTVSTSLPINRVLCPVLSTTNGTLVSALRPITVVLGAVRNATITGFFNVTL
ncbi:pollen Ole e 1 allergen and extensin family protein [Striga asiatica]|uniref:Pollen Ole e 1 allergen and extensin family protein n=1 Tax=Striga asiatica TaxID=4170 RepID=A0A5A7R7W8_STRAF|nr:pollen Ole e 1 allergen and extensin family protein [Striga asiatica]